MKQSYWYAMFAEDFQGWHYRMTPKGRERADACWLLSMLETFNVFALSLWVPRVDLSRWAFLAVFVTCFFVLYVLNKRVFDRIQVSATCATWADLVPSFKEFPRVYSYLLLTVAMLVAPLFVAHSPPA